MNISADQQTRLYELTYLIPTSYTDSERTEIAESVQKLLEKHDVSLQETEDWGKRQLAYQIRHGSQAQDEAYYTHLRLEADPANIQAFEKELYLVDEVMRHLLVVAAEQE